MDIVKYLNARIEGNSVSSIKKKDVAEILAVSAVLHAKEESAQGECLSFEEAVHFAEKGLSVDSDGQISDHLATCGQCRQMLFDISEAAKKKNIKIKDSIKDIRANSRKKMNIGFDVDIKKYLAPAVVLIAFVFFAVFIGKDLFRNGDRPWKFSVKADASVIKTIIDEDTRIIQNSSGSYKNEQESAYTLTGEKMFRAGYVFFMLQNSGGRNPLFEDILSRDISKSGEDHMDIALAVGDREFPRIKELISSIPGDLESKFREGYVAGYFVYKLKEAADTSAGVSEAESCDLDDYAAVEKIIDAVDDEKDYSADLTAFRNSVFSLSLK